MHKHLMLFLLAEEITEFLLLNYVDLNVLRVMFVLDPHRLERSRQLFHSIWQSTNSTIPGETNLIMSMFYHFAVQFQSLLTMLSRRYLSVLMSCALLLW